MAAKITVIFTEKLSFIKLVYM